MNIYQKLAKVRKSVEVLQKNASGYGYNYVTEEVILSKITGLMQKLHISLLPSIVPGTHKVSPYHYIKTKLTPKKEVYEEHNNEIIVQADMVWSWINDDNPTDRHDVPWMLVGSQSDASQAFGSALTYASRYFLLKFFNIATVDDDPDKWRSEQQNEAVREIIGQVHELVTGKLEAYPDARTEVTNIIKKYAKDKDGKPAVNYYVIKDVATASKLLEALADYFIQKEGK